MSTTPEKLPHVPRGSRKLKHCREMAGLLFLGYLVAAYLKVPETLFAGFVAGLGTLSGAFVWGNVKEHQSKPIPETPTT